MTLVAGGEEESFGWAREEKVGFSGQLEEGVRTLEGFEGKGNERAGQEEGKECCTWWTIGVSVSGQFSQEVMLREKRGLSDGRKSIRSREGR